MLRRRRAITLCLACLSAPLLLPGSAAASIGIESFSPSLATAQAGAHPDLNVDFSFEHPGEPETALTAAVELPPGFFLYPGLAPRCTDNQFTTLECPIGSQVGVVTIHGNHEGNPDFELGMAPVYMRTRENGELAHLAFVIPTVEAVVNVPVTTTAETEYAPMLFFEGLPKATPIASIDFELWGIPAAPDHDALRFPIVPGGRPSNIPQEPFTRNPTACGETSSTLYAASYEDIGNPSTMTVGSPSIVGCGKLGHPYSLEFALGSTEAATAAGLEVELLNHQDLTPAGLSSPDLESASVFVDGLEIDEGAASALSVCTPAQAHLGDNDPADCPPGSKIGTLTAAVAGTEDPLAGSVYLGAAEPSGEYEVFLVATGSGIELKIPAWLGSGLEIPELPQLPLAKLDVRVDPATSVLLTLPHAAPSMPSAK
ncbi:MAG: hypothetical protein ACTHNP_09730 [Solirubrobacterales bacterium]